MRITAGRLRGKRLEAPPGQAVRPTSDRAREALFNVLVHRFQGNGRFTLVGARVLDACAGTGALGLEALSRGAAHVTFLDRDPAQVGALQELARAWGIAAETTVSRADVTRPPPAPAPCALVLMDPPYGQDLAKPALVALDRAGWIAPDALCVVETDRHDPLEPPAGFTLADDRAQGRARLRILRRDGA
ncbi:16S rRNA (guanine(966)-N(2))-methyltransferase RsmD [Roseospira visakhapatnamensis]|uniref:16S rRNA (Guanine966-N2)-methyltransferase n=1 Tax=Roseospira visakhapatnamensis TaxID=390880 RepID=A0A7W6RD35_9PROT|nr:16S rRNA (guanine(966)-N(2))-methyltransferase RsmD [Roseospira visakhapatnamensis]MBB4266067.1 16S rRNA (guanine966-N2)-methyltransferase [Roseospira visakhapatnamensis]